MMLSLILSLGFISSAAVVTAYTSDSVEEFSDGGQLSFGVLREYLPVDYVDSIFLAEKLVCDAILNGETTVNVEHLKFDSTYINLNCLSTFSPYLNGKVDITPYFHTGECYNRVEIDCSMTPDEAALYFAQVDSKLNYIKSLTAEAKTDFDKILILHDYLVYSAEYDYDNYLNGTIPEESYRSCGVLMYGRGVCQSYSYAYMYLLSLEGIECHVTKSDSMSHAWNIVKLDGKFYHVDVTWDDPVRDRVGRVVHKHFLRSDAAFIAGDEENKVRSHYGWEDDSPRCTSDVYDNAYWHTVSSAILSYGNAEYYIKGDGVCKRDADGTETQIASPGTWSVWEGGAHWVGAYSGLALVEGELYYNTPTEVRKINLATMKDSAVFTPDTSAGYIYGFVIDGATLRYTISKSPNEAGDVFAKELDIPTPDKVTLNRSTLTLEVGGVSRLVLRGITKDLEWTTSDPAVASVDLDGKVTAVSEGVATIAVTAKNGSSAQCTVTVRRVEMVDSAEKFTDLEVKSWSKEGIDYVVSYGYMNGTGNGTTFDQTGTMTRAMIVSVLHRMADKPATAVANPFSDLEAGQTWYHDAVIWAYEHGIVTGTSETTFAPTGAVTREQMATFLYRYARFMGYDVSATADLTVFPDAGKVGSWSMDALAWANATGLITGAVGSDGVTRLDPQGMATREQVATILMRFCKTVQM